MTEMLTMKRRSFLTGSAGAVVAAGAGGLAEAKETKPLPDYVAWKDADALIVHSDKTLETKRSEFGTSIITPEDKLYIRNNVNTPPESILDDRDGWKVEIAGVKEPPDAHCRRTEDSGSGDGGDCTAMFGQWPQILQGSADG
ncbi:hypothetical protein Q1M63_33185 [Sinorhizobium meliloti]|nr:hypothetical protein Q1M63_33185 [Sinorhizobium meliloti]